METEPVAWAVSRFSFNPGDRVYVVDDWPGERGRVPFIGQHGEVLAMKRNRVNNSIRFSYEILFDDDTEASHMRHRWLRPER